jgi:Branched-chain polyamine synthase A C-terminal domain
MDQRVRDAAGELLRALRTAPRADRAASLTTVERLIRRACRGGRLDDIIRSDLTLTSGIWLLGKLCEAGVVRVDHSGTVYPACAEPTGAATADGALVDAGLGGGLIDWQVMEGVLKRRPYPPSNEFFQSYDTCASLRRRLAIMDQHDDLAGRTVLQLGDDNMFSVALGLVPGMGHVHVADIDPRMLAAIADEAHALGLRLTMHRVDVLRQQVPVQGVDTFMVSNLKDAGGLALCAAAAVATTAGAGAVGYLSFALDVYRPGFTDRQVFRSVAKMLERLDCVLTALVACDEPELDDDQLADLAVVVSTVARGRADVSQVAALLEDLRHQSGWKVLALRHGYPDVSLRPAMLARVVTGADSVRQARRVLRFLQRAVRP